ncbi:non-ribosomal peptide synthetase, partial [Alteromonas sp. a30]|uniref:non-ribosomal peptide synthetase n=1 Tax=Alteromonas sp. a30 TaxID=2730917 RepID=UPI00227E0A9B
MNISIEQLLNACIEAGIYLSIDTNTTETPQLKIQFKGEAIAPELLAQLKQYKAELVAHLQAVQSAQTAKTSSIARVSQRQTETAWQQAASYGQQRLWFIEQFSGNANEYNMLGALRVRGEISEAACRVALEQLIARHEILRTRFIDVDGEPMQEIQPHLAPAFEVTQLESEMEVDACIEQVLQDESQHHFDLTQATLFKTRLVRFSNNDGLLVFNLHHIICDDWSVGILLSEFAGFYNQAQSGLTADNQTPQVQRSLPELPVQYADFAAWQKNWLNSDKAHASTEFWKRYLAHAPELHSLPLDHARPSTPSNPAKRFEVKLGTARKAGLQQLAEQTDSTLFVVLQSLFAVLIARFGRHNDVVMGTPVAGRQHPDLDGLIGFFVNTIALRHQVDLSLPTQDYLVQSRDTIVNAFEHQYLPFDAVIEAVNPERSSRYSPLFQILFSLLEDTDLPVQLQGVDIQSVAHELTQAKFDLQLTVVNNASLSTYWLFNTSLFEEVSIRRLSDAFLALIDAAIAQPRVALAELPLVSDLARQQLLRFGEGSSVAFDENNTSNQLSTPDALAQTVALMPNQVALKTQQQQLTYAELYAHSNQLAQRLISLGVTQGDAIALLLPRSMDAVIAIYAVWQAGAAYVPIDPSYPKARIAYMLNDAKPNVVLSYLEYDSLLSEAKVSANRLYLDAPVTNANTECSTKNLPDIRPSDTAYIIYTSGSTGNPKGVVVTHGNLNNLRQGLREICSTYFNLHVDPALADENASQQQDESRSQTKGQVETLRWGWNTSYAFDSSLKALSLLATGVSLYILDEQQRKQSQHLLALFAREQIDIYDCTPSQLDTLLDISDSSELQALPHLALGGEPISTRLWQRIADLSEQNQRCALNLYGPTECTVDTTFAVIERRLAKASRASDAKTAFVHANLAQTRNVKPNIGRPLPNYACCIVDENGHLLPMGAVGELWVSGAGVTEGYLNQPALSAEKFVSANFDYFPCIESYKKASRGDVSDKSDVQIALDTAVRYYKTGDIVRWNHVGQLEYLGRADNQVKLRGYRIELDEIQTHIGALEGVKDNVVMLDPRNNTNLICYFTGKDESSRAALQTTQGISALKARLGEQLPTFMVPALFIPVETFTFTPNGKLDTKALPSPQDFIVLNTDTVASSAAHDANNQHGTVTPTEQAIAVMWSSLLQIEQPKVDDNFFASGGHSLLATRLVARIRDKFAVELPLQRLFAQPSIRGISANVDALLAANVEPITDAVNSANVSPANSIPALSASERPTHIPLSFSQKKLWILEQLAESGENSNSDSSRDSSADEKAQEPVGVYNMVFGLRLQGMLHLDAFKQALMQLVARHESLRTLIVTSSNAEQDKQHQTPYQFIQPSDAFAVTVMDVRQKLAAETTSKTEKTLENAKQTIIDAALHQAASQRFDLAKDLPFSAQIIILDDAECANQTGADGYSNDHAAIFVMHHIATDGWSSGVFIRELNQLYTQLTANVSQKATLPVPTLQYADYAIWQQQQWQSGAMQASLDYWIKHLQACPTVHGLPIENPRPQVQTFAGKHHHSNTGKALAHKLYALAKQQQVSLFALLESAFALLVSRWSNSDDIVIGVPVANREQAGVSELVGFLANTVALRTRLNENMDFSGYLAQNASVITEGLSHQHIPFEWVVEKLNPPRSQSHTPVFQIMFTLNNNEQVELSLPKVNVTPLSLENNIAKFELGIAVQEQAGDLQFIWEYNTALFSETFAQRLSASFMVLLQSIVDAPSQNILQLPLLPQAELHTLLHQWNSPEYSASFMQGTRSEKASQPIHLATWFEACAERYANLPAIHAEGANSHFHATFDAVNCRANQVARLLLSLNKSKQNTSDSVDWHQQKIGVCYGRHQDVIISSIAALKLGALFVPIDPEFPAERVSYILDDTALPLVLTDNEGAACLADGSLAGRNIQVINTQAQAVNQALPDYDSANLTLNEVGGEFSAQDLAYLIYTSGSTGKPKGVMVQHSNIVNYLSAMTRMLNQPQGGVYSAWTNAIFDYAVSEWFVPLLSGGCVHMLKGEQRTDPDTFFRYLQQQQVSVTYVPPFFLRAFNEWLRESPRHLALKAMIVGLEPIDQALLQSIKSQVDGLQIFNGYGPTEATIACTFFNVPSALQTHSKEIAIHASQNSKNTPIGRPIANVTHYVVNSKGQLAPIGVAGELLIGGAGLAKGYLNKPDASAAAFVQHLFADDATHSADSRVYCTGDWVKYLPDGNIEFVGRIDNQVKISGLRVELGEIEVQLANCDLVAQCAVVARPIAQASAATEKKIVAFVVPSSVALDKPHLLADKQALSESIKAHLRQTLPEFMLPSVIQTLTALPMTATDKVDRKTLMQQTLDIHKSGTSGPVVANKITQQLLVLWQEVLGLEQIGLDDNFFELGGTSLNVVMLTNKIKASMLPELKAVDVFTHASINGLSAHIQHALKKQQSSDTHDDNAHEHLNQTRNKKGSSRDIAIIGMAGSFPKASNIEEFWHNLEQGLEGISHFDREQGLAYGISETLLDNPNYIRARGILSRSLEFDAAFFDYKPREAQIIDPQLRLLHECAWQTLEAAGYAVDASASNTGSQPRIGLYGGASNNLLWLQQVFQTASQIGSDIYDLATLGDREFFMARVANKLNLTGPALNVQSACSTSLVAVHTAIQGILNGDCDMALAGGVSLRANKEGYLYQEGMINSPDGHCRAFDAKAKGTVGGEGVGLVLLKRLEDAEADGDRILAVIKGSAINNDGVHKVGFTAPSV